MNARLPRYLVLGGPIPVALAAELSGVVELVTEAPDEPGADGLLVHARPDALGAVRRFREDGGTLPIYGLAEDAPIAERVRWVREGADDLLTRTRAGAVLAQRLGRSEEATSVGLRVDRWLQATSRYLGAREGAVALLGDGGRSRYLDCVFLRDQVMRVGDGDTTADVFGQRRGADRESLRWPIDILAPAPGAGELENIGPDGACLAVFVQPGANQRLSVRVAGESVVASLELEARWQRRVGRGRWQVGALTLACRLVDPDPTRAG